MGRVRQGRQTSKYKGIIKVTAVGSRTSRTSEELQSCLHEGQEVGSPFISYHAPIPVFSTVLEKTLGRMWKDWLSGGRFVPRTAAEIGVTLAPEAYAANNPIENRQKI